MKPTRSTIIFLFIIFSVCLRGQGSSFDSFISRLSDQYKVDVALAPELIPALDSLKNLGSGISGIEELLQHLLKNRNVTYRVVDGNKILLRREFNEVRHDLNLVEGTIIDSRSKEPLAYAAVSILNSNRGTYTDEKGRFKLYVDDTGSSLQINYLGFKPLTVFASAFSTGHATVEMEPDQISLEQILIVVPFYQMSSSTGTQALDLKGYQFLTEDDLLHLNSDRLITQLTGYSHFSSEEGIRIRGSEEENSLVVMDGLPVYDPYHYYNIFSPFNGHYFSEVSLYKNNMPVEYGGRIDGLIELSSAHTGKKSRLILDTDLLLTSLSMDLGITDHIRLLAGGRVSHTDVLFKSLRDSSSANFTIPGQFRDENEWSSSQQPSFDFYDINLGLKAALGVKSSIDITYYKSKDFLDNRIVNEISTTVNNHEIISVEQKIDSRDDWMNEGIAAGLQTQLGDKSRLWLNGFISTYEKNIAYDYFQKEHFLNIHRMTMNKGLQNSLLHSYGLKGFIEKKVTDVSVYLLGLDFQRHEVDLLAIENNTPYLLEVQEENETTLFGEYKHRLLEKLEIAVGGRLTHLSSTQDLYPQPNIRANYYMDEGWMLKSSYSKNIQALRELTVENRFGREVEFLALSQPDAGYPVLKSDKYMIGAGFISKHFTLDGELYYKKTNGLISVRAQKPNPNFDDQTSPGDFYRMFTGDGWTAGFDLLANFKYKKSETSVSYTLSKISQRFDKLFNGNSFSPTEDRRHQVKVSSRYNLGRFIVSGLLTYKTKAPYISFIRLEQQDGSGGPGGIGMADYEMVLKYLPSYFSLDLGVDYSFRTAKHPAMIGFSLINATNHVNINDVQHIGRISRDTGMGGLFITHETELLGRTLNVHFRYLLD